ncbi:LysR family transcriptional regulator [Phaeobacter sp. C3_T13_0]|uniref:LysR family transcriptional regulator n=1 Tax=Phaeobacter cretensis TaxID=3342641 RepID=UPI0039BC66AC
MHQQRATLPPLEWIRAFEAAARCGSFTAAAVEIGITQSAISQRIAQLEKRLGAVLFHRHPRAITLTVEGEAWLPHIQSALDTMRDSSEALFGTGRRHLTISASQSVIDLWLAPRLNALSEIAGGQLAVQTMVLGAHDAPEDEMIRIRYGVGDWPHPYKMPLYSEEITPMAAPGLINSSGHWSEWPRIACSGPRPDWSDWVAHYGGGTTPVPHLRFDTFLSALGAARVGAGVLLGSQALCRADLATERLMRLSRDQMDHHATYWVISGKDAVTRAQWADLTRIMT